MEPCGAGLFVHSSADSTNDFTVAFKPNGSLAMELRDCADISIP